MDCLMRALSVLAVLVFTCFLAQSSALWSDTWDAVKNTGNWVRNNCRVGVGLSLSPGVDFSCALKGRKRDVNNNKAASLNATCNDMKPNPLASDGGFSYQLVRRVFKDADGSGNRDDADGVLDLAEYAQFSETLEVFFYCLAKNE